MLQGDQPGDPRHDLPVRSDPKFALPDRTEGLPDRVPPLPASGTLLTVSPLP